MTDLLHTITAGQSLSIGGTGTPALSTSSEETNAKTVNAGGGLSNLLSTVAQRPDLSMGYALARQRPAQTLGFSTHGQGSQTIAALSKGGATGKYEEAITRISDAHGVSGRTHLVESWHWIQGEADQGAGTSLADYLTALLAYQSDVLADVEAITGQVEVPIILSQTASWADYGTPARIGLAQLDAARNHAGFWIIGGQYHLPYNDGLHPTNVGYYFLGEYHARAQQAVVDGAPWLPFAPREYVVTPAYVDVIYDVPTGSLEFDTTTLPAQTHMGFSLSGTSASITGVLLVGSDTVRLTLNQPITEGSAAVGYGVASSVGGVGAGNLCDGETAVSAYDGSTRLANWALHSHDAISVEPVTGYDISSAYITGSDRLLYPLNPLTD